jgi:hypothetical protein
MRVKKLSLELQGMVSRGKEREGGRAQLRKIAERVHASHSVIEEAGSRTHQVTGRTSRTSVFDR